MSRRAAHLECYADLPGLWYVSGYHEGYKQSAGAFIAGNLVVLKDGPILVIDHVEGRQGHTAQWNFHTPLEASVEPDRSVTSKANMFISSCLPSPRN